MANPTDTASGLPDANPTARDRGRPKRKLATTADYAAAKFGPCEGIDEAIGDRLKWLQRADSDFPTVKVMAILLGKDDAGLAETVTGGDADLWVETYERLERCRISYEGLVALLEKAGLRILAAMARREIGEVRA